MLSQDVSSSSTLKKVYNIVDQKDEEITKVELYGKFKHPPKLEGLKEPDKVREILKDAIDKYTNPSFKFPAP